MKITKISIEKLFGIFDHEIPLNIEERITIIHGLNGFGKTTILRMIDSFFKADYSQLLSIPFKKVIVYFDDDHALQIEKENIELTLDNWKVKFRFDKSKLGEFYYCPVLAVDSQFQILQNRLALVSKEQKSPSQAKKSHSINKTGTQQRSNVVLSFSDEPEWLSKIRNEVNIRLIESQRLLDIRNVDYSSMLLTVSTYSKEIAKIMQNKFSEYGRESQSLDRTFPIRALQQQHSTRFTDAQLKIQLNELDKKRDRLTDLGLLDQEESTSFPTQLQDIDESTRNILSVYVEDTNKKLNIFSDLASKIELLRKIINRKFAYSYKEMNFSKEAGFIFTSRYPNSDLAESKTLSPTDLSSGEQHELVLLYELLFKVEPNSLVLIDEPELSLHISWQSQFLKDLKEITELADLDILLATHSPDIIQDRWDDLTVELKAPEKS